MTDELPIPPLDDVITTAEVCARILARKEALRAYRRLSRDIRAASAEWAGTEASTRLLLHVYDREFRKILGIEGEDRP